MNTQRKLSRWILVLFSLSFLSSCGNDSQAPADGSILINPTDVSLSVGHDPATLGSCVPQIVDQPFVITIFDRAGVELGNIDIEVHLSFAPGSASPGLNVLALYDSDISQIPLTFVTSPFQTQTNAQGQKYVVARLLTGCALSYDSQLSVTSGSLYDISDISVSSPSI